MKKKTKIIRAQFYFELNKEKDEFYNQQLELIEDEFKDFDIYWAASDAEIGDDPMQVVLFDVEARAFTFKEAEKLYKMFKKEVASKCGEKCHEQICMQLEKVI